MIKRKQVFVRGKRKDGSWGPIDVLDLDETSFRAFVTQKLCAMGVVHSIVDDVVAGETVTLEEAKGG